MKLSSKCLAVILIIMASVHPCMAEMLDLSLLGEIQEAQMIEEDVQWTYPIAYDLLKTSEYIRLINRENLLEEDYIPADLLKDLSCRKVSYDPIQMSETAANALYTLFDAAQEDGIYLYAHSGYRSYRTQKTMYYNRLEKNKGKDDGIVQCPGASENSKQGKWLAENCWDYGFILRYPKDKEDITGISYESWHIRYVGVQVAQYMRDHDMCLEEFTAEWQEAVATYEAAGGK